MPIAYVVLAALVATWMVGLVVVSDVIGRE